MYPQHVLKEGYTDVPHYGLLLAKSVHLPADVLAEATRIASFLDVQVLRSMWLMNISFSFFLLKFTLHCCPNRSLDDFKLATVSMPHSAAHTW